MLFNSWQFSVFLPIVFALYWAFPHSFRWILLFLASYYFYMSWNIKYVSLIFFTTVVSYTAALLLERFRRPGVRKIVLFCALSSCLGVLFVFKYFNFFSEAFTGFLNSLGVPLHPVTLKLLLPVGISFYTFQTMSYIIDVYRGKIRAESHFGIYATFISFFPQLVAGPIERTENLLPQIRAEHHFDYNQAVCGLKLMAWGFFKKLVIADNLAITVDRIYNDVFQYRGFVLVVAALFFSIQIYCDFSGYSDIARGTAQLMGVELIENFRSPYLSASIREFWSRWHISLSTFFRDYVYIPLGGSRVNKTRHNLNLLITFLVSGLWHGANWTFLVWGGVHGIAQIIENGLKPKTPSKGWIWWLRVCFVFIFVTAAWTFFRAQNIEEALYIFYNCSAKINTPGHYFSAGYRDLYLNKYELIHLFCAISLLFVYDYYQLKGEAIHSLRQLSLLKRWGLYYGLVLWILISGNFGNNQFVYFQF